MKIKSALYFMLCIFYTSCNYMNTQEVKKAKVLDKERITEVNDGNTSSYYLIFTDQGEYTITDELFRGNFSSSSWYGLLEKEKCYNFDVGGFRVSFVSRYQNIHSKPEQCDCD